ncbi:hypothetical protein SPRG_19576 [Saprolegnia parasitica CBS 223.65]|uniref:Uncharacterized protein n=1 Tax=Saprolegnia parasitica (strain CBS 223.65) TaxID=695850 RepID=A0A067CKI6_SAPPC|nr:hypothetical protein SPRG_19576 [Saprolegnia parasitica CBS 223.65]KDO31048.1 hypothetical protein SPRG_19576 [Saprolegnia parasitica CBS 223.65]|eukprot:XP_012198309.1 hypothetical protein SPRG_19576 [Saprolegnia parasitica CBS 223.65]
MAWFETFGSRWFFDTVERERYVDTSMLCDLLLQQRRLDLIECFLQEHCVYFQDCARDYASFIHSVLTIYGWEPLASTLDVLLTKWPLVGAMRLVASLAGVALDPVCPPLQRPFAKELIKTCFCRLVVVTSTAVGADFALWRNGIAGLQQLVADVLLLQTYLMTLSESAQHGSYLDAYLPAPLVHLVDSFLVPLSFVDAVILKQRSIFDPVAVVGPAVLTLREHVPPATLAPLVAPLLATAQELPNDMTLHGLIAYLCLAPDLGMDLVATMATRYPLLFVPAMRAVAKDHCDALDVMAIGAMVLELSARLFEDEATTSQLVVHYEQSMAWPTTATVVEFCILGLLTDATTFLDAYAPSQLQAFAIAWTDALRGSAQRIDFFTHCVFCLLYTLHDVCARHKDVGVFLASTCRTELGAIATQVAATLPPLPSVAMAIDDGLANDCASCADFATFLQNAAVREYIGKTYATTGTPALCAHVRAIAVPAQCLRMEDRQSFLGSVYIRKEPRGVDVAAWDALAKEHMMLAGLPSRMRYMDEWIAAWTSEEATASGASS